MKLLGNLYCILFKKAKSTFHMLLHWSAPNLYKSGSINIHNPLYRQGCRQNHGKWMSQVSGANVGVSESKDPVDCSARENRPSYTWASHSGPMAHELKDVLQQKGRHPDILALWVISAHGGYKYLSTCLCKLKYKNNKPWQFVPQGSKCFRSLEMIICESTNSSCDSSPQRITLDAVILHLPAIPFYISP